MTSPLHNYEQAIEFLFGRVNFERTPASGKQDFKLNRMRRLLELLGNPHEQLPCVHIAGTKGKGSTAVMLAEILSAAGYRTGLYTSPHVEAFEERMQVAGQRPSRDELIELTCDVQAAVWQCEAEPQPFSPTFFEVTTALAWLFFLRRQTQIVVLEVGLGGRLDSTNVCHPVACVLTTISRDHTQILGSTLTQIAREKAGIVKPHVPVVSGVMGDEAQAVIDETCREQTAELWQLGREFSYVYLPAKASGPASPNCGHVDVMTPRHHWLEVPLPLVGEHQAHNAAVALATIDRLTNAGWPVSTEAARRGMANVRWPTRIEVVRRNPTVIVDAAHNWESAAALGRTLDETFPRRTSSGESTWRVLIFAATKDKDAVGILRQLLPRFDTVIFTQYLNNPRAVPPESLARLAHTFTAQPCHVAPTPEDAWQLAERLTPPNGLICVTGSFFIAAELRERILTDQGCSASAS